MCIASKQTVQSCSGTKFLLGWLLTFNCVHLRVNPHGCDAIIFSVLYHALMGTGDLKRSYFVHAGRKSMASVIASAPGKASVCSFVLLGDASMQIILSGEHAVVHGTHALATVINKRTYVQLTALPGASCSACHALNRSPCSECD